MYGTAQGLADLSEFSDWENDSDFSGGASLISDIHHANQFRVKGLENIYLQRLEPAGAALPKKSKKRTQKSKPKFRVMHHKYHDEGIWHQEDQHELQSMMSDNDGLDIEFADRREFGVPKKVKSRKQEQDKPNIFHGNFHQYKEKMKQESQPQVNF